MMKKSLDGIRIIDLSHVLAAPFCTMILADLGAEVIKVEPPIGDDSRQFGPFIKEKNSENTQSGYFISINRNKKSTCVNLKSEEGKEILRKMIATADVVVENFRPDTMKKLGFSYEEMKEIKSDIIYCSICGFGHDALPEYATKPAYDMVAQAFSGLMSVTGPSDGEPCRVGTSVGDIVAGHQGAIGILSALWYRNRTGKGQYIDISMVDGLVYILENAIARYTINGEIPNALGTAHPTITPFQAFKTKDDWIVTPIGNDKLWLNFCKAINQEYLTNLNEFKSNQMRTKNKDELTKIIASVIKNKTTSEWENIFSEYGLPYSAVNTIDKIVENDQINYRKMIVEIDQPKVGKMKIMGTPFKMSETPGMITGPAPLLGEHTGDVLKELLNFDDSQIENLKNLKIIK